MPDTLVLTGASSGIGRSLAHHLAGRYHVIALARRIERMEAEFETTPDVTPYELNLEEVGAIRDRMAEIRERHGTPRYLINNAGINVGSAVAALDPDDLVRSMRVNAVAPVVLLQELLPGMVETEFGRVINVTSGAPLNCPAGAGSYSGSKAALNALTVTAANEWRDRNIKINLMSPGPCRTEMAPDGPLAPAACHPTVDYLLALDEDGPTGRFFWLGYDVPLFPELGDVQWMEGIGSDRMTRVLDGEPHRPEA